MTAREKYEKALKDVYLLILKSEKVNPLDSVKKTILLHKKIIALKRKVILLFRKVHWAESNRRKK